MTDPSDRVTYEITRDHQALLDELVTTGNGEVAHALNIVPRGHAPGSYDLTDARDAFDVVVDDTADEAAHRLQSRALDDEMRADTWLSTHEEQVHGTDA